MNTRITARELAIGDKVIYPLPRLVDGKVVTVWHVGTKISHVGGIRVTVECGPDCAGGHDRTYKVMPTDVLTIA